MSATDLPTVRWELRSDRPSWHPDDCNGACCRRRIAGEVADLPTARLRQLRDGHDPDDAHAGRARTARINRLQTDIVAADELVVELGRYRILTVKVEVRPDVRQLVDRQVRQMIHQTAEERVRLERELRALQ